MKERITGFLEANIEGLLDEIRSEPDARVKLELIRWLADRSLGKVSESVAVSGTVTLEALLHRRAIERTNAVTVEVTPLLEAPDPASVPLSKPGGPLATPDYRAFDAGSDDALEGPEKARLNAERSQKEPENVRESAPAVGSKPRSPGSADA